LSLSTTVTSVPPLMPLTAIVAALRG